MGLFWVAGLKVRVLESSSIVGMRLVCLFVLLLALLDDFITKIDDV